MFCHKFIRMNTEKNMGNTNTIVATLCFPITADSILLGKKKKRLGVGWWNGFGGRVEVGETIEEATCRETKEECGFLTREKDLDYVARVLFKYPQENWDVHIFFVRLWSGKICESDEMGELTWFLYKNIPYASMWPSDKKWLPRVLCGEKIQGSVTFTNDKKIKETSFSRTQSLLLPRV